MRIDDAQERKISGARSWIANRIRSIRKARGYTQTQVAKKMGVVFSRISDLEREVSDYKVSTLLRVACVLGVSPGELLRGCPGSDSQPQTNPEPVVIFTQAELVEWLNSECGISKRMAKELFRRKASSSVG